VPAPKDRWLDQDAGPVVRPYAVTRGRTAPDASAGIGLIDFVAAVPGQPQSGAMRLGPEHRQLLACCPRPVTVVDLAADVDLPVGVVQVLLSDLSEYGLIRVTASHRGPVTSESVLRAVLHGLKAL
jgi:hypothetical protein